MAPTKISVIVPAFNEEKLIVRSLRAIQSAAKSFAQRGWATELIVCDNNSSDRTAQLASDAGARVVFEPVNQIARARNRGAEAASGDWLMFVDADSFPTAGLFDAVARRIEAGTFIGGGCTVRLDEFHWGAWLLTRGWNLLSRLTGWAAGSFIFCEAGAFRELRGFSPDLYVAEEIEFSRRLRQLARRSGKRTVIIGCPLLTSARKIHLYSRREHLRFLRRLGSDPHRTLKDPAACQPWYDGRR